MPLTTLASIASRDVVLVLAPVTSDEPVRVSYSLDADEVASLTGDEARATRQSALRITQRVTLTLSGAEAALMRDMLRDRGERRVAIPLWADVRPADDMTAVHESAFTANFDAEGNFDFLPAGQSAYTSRAPVLIGRLTAEPKWTAFDDDSAEVEITVEEDAPYAARIRIAAGADMQAFDLSADWSDDPTEESATQLRTEEIGNGRERPLRGAEAEAKRVFAAGFALDRPQARKLLAFFVAHGGTRDSFSCRPLWSPETAAGVPAAGVTVRFAADLLSLDWSLAGYAETTIQMRQDIPGPVSPSRPSVARLFRFSRELGIGGGFSGQPGQFEAVFAGAFTDWEAPIVLGADTYLPRAIEATGLHHTMTPEGDEIEIVADAFGPDNGVGGDGGLGNPMRSLVTLDFETALRVEIRECDPANPAQAQTIFDGLVRRVSASGRTLRGTCSTLGNIFKRSLPSSLVQTTCNASLGDANCGIVVPSVIGTVTAISGAIVEVTGGAGFAADWYAHGWAVFGADPERRGILRSEPLPSFAGQRLTLTRPLTRSGLGAQVTFFAGCDGQFSTCKNKFANARRFFGFPRLPSFIESISTSFKPKVGKF